VLEGPGPGCLGWVGDGAELYCRWHEWEVRELEDFGRCCAEEVVDGVGAAVPREGRLELTQWVRLCDGGGRLVGWVSKWMDGWMDSEWITLYIKIGMGLTLACLRGLRALFLLWVGWGWS